MGFPRKEYWSRVAILFSRGSSPPRDQTEVSRIAGRATREVKGKDKWKMDRLLLEKTLTQIIKSFILHQTFTEHLDFVLRCYFLLGTLLGAQRGIGAGFMR